jgi:hypothetical protein
MPAMLQADDPKIQQGICLRAMPGDRHPFYGGFKVQTALEATHSPILGAFRKKGELGGILQTKTF